MRVNPRKTIGWDFWFWNLLVCGAPGFALWGYLHYKVRPEMRSANHELTQLIQKQEEENEDELATRIEKHIVDSYQEEMVERDRHLTELKKIATDQEVAILRRQVAQMELKIDQLIGNVGKYVVDRVLKDVESKTSIASYERDRDVQALYTKYVLLTKGPAEGTRSVIAR